MYDQQCLKTGGDHTEKRVFLQRAGHRRDEWVENVVAKARLLIFLALSSLPHIYMLSLEPKVSCILGEHFATEPPALPTLSTLDPTVIEGISGAQRPPGFPSCQCDFVLNDLVFSSHCLVDNSLI